MVKLWHNVLVVLMLGNLYTPWSYTCDIPIFGNLKRYYNKMVAPKTKVAVVVISGVIQDSTVIVDQIKTFFERDDIKAIVLKIDSPGGAPGTAQTVHYVIRSLSQRYGKPIVAWIENIGTSAAYYIASAADYIICTPSALVASVGVISQFPYLKDFIEQFKAQYIVVTAGKYKGMGNPYLELTPEQRQAFEEHLKEVHERFIQDVLAARPQLLDRERVLWAEGQPIHGEKALELGLVDKLGSSLEVEEYLKLRLGGQIIWVHAPKKSQLARLLEGVDSQKRDHPYIQAIVDCFCERLGIYMNQNPVRL